MLKYKYKNALTYISYEIFLNYMQCLYDMLIYNIIQINVRIITSCLP